MKRTILGIFCLFALGLHADEFTLEQCQQMALENNRTLQNARIDMNMADEDKTIAFTNYFPSVSANITGFIAAKDLIRSEMDLSQAAAAYNPALAQMGMGIPESISISSMKKGAFTDVMAMQPLYSGGRIMNGNKLAALQQEVRRLQYQMSEKTILQSVAEYYWQIVSLQGNVATLDVVDKQLEGVHKFTEDYVKAGVIDRNNLLQVELKQQEIQSSRLQVSNAISLLNMVLAQLCGADIEGFAIAKREFTVEACAKPDTYFISPAEAVSNREELMLAGKNVTAQGLQVKMERGKYLPSVAIGAAGMYQAMDMGDSMENMNNGNLIGLATVSIPISDWWSGKHALKKARLNQQKAENDRQDAEEKLQIDILSAWNNLTEGYAQIEVAQRSIASADENLRIYTDKYRTGTIDATDMLNAVTLYTQAHNNLTSAIATYQTRVSDYLRKTR